MRFEHAPCGCFWFDWRRPAGIIVLRAYSTLALIPVPPARRAPMKSNPMKLANREASIVKREENVKRKKEDERQKRKQEEAPKSYRMKLFLLSNCCNGRGKRWPLLEGAATLLVLLLAATCYGPANGQRDEVSASGNPTTTRPTSAIRNVTAQVGQSVLLHCLVEPSSELSVSWFRGAGELQLLTYESNTVIQDERFVVRHGSGAQEDDWVLHIKALERSDGGLYQCQTNSERGQFYQLNVVEPQVHILGAPDLAVKMGAPINLTCIISQSPDQLQFVFWYRDERMINYDVVGERGRIAIAKWPQKANTVSSNLQIFSAHSEDAGNYTCYPSGARPTSVFVHVLEGSDKRLAMFQNDFGQPSASSSASQTNSALSIHVANQLTNGYALLVALAIFSAWFQLVAQAQTAISLALLAIIGLLLGQLTSAYSSRRKSTLESADEFELLAKVRALSESLANGQQDKRAEGACPGQLSPLSGTLMPAKPLTSPTVSTSSSNSTGYNSGARELRVNAEGELIELARQPTALRLIMDEFARSPSCLSSTSATCSPYRAPRSGSSSVSVAASCCLNEEAEPLYSAPRSRTQTPSDVFPSASVAPSGEGPANTT